MGHRLSKIYTRTGDDGTTGLGDGSRANKDSLRIGTLGEVDELNASIGVLAAEHLPGTYLDALMRIQHDLFDLGGELSIPGHIMLKESRISWIEELLDELNESLSPLKEFILPGGCRQAALCHLSRTVCRRAERTLVQLAQTEKVSAVGLRYLNRLSDLLFVMARALNAANGVKDILWQRDQSLPS